MKSKSAYEIIPQGTDGVSCGKGDPFVQEYSIELLLRNAADLADWLLDYNLTPDQHKSIINMLNSNDPDSKVLGLELIKIKKEQLNGNPIYSS